MNTWLQDGASSVENRISVRHAILGQLAKTGGAKHFKPDEREDAIAAEFFEYKLLHDFSESQGPESKDYEIGGHDEQGIKRIHVKLRRRILPPRGEFIKSEKIQEWLKTNRLLRSQVEMDMYCIRGIWLPKGARLSLGSQVVNTIPEKVISIEVPGVLDISIRIQRLGSPGFGYLPPLWDASDAQIDAILADYGIPSPVEWATPGSYIQTTTRWQVEDNRKKNDIVFIPVGCTELHGQHLPSASDTLYVSAICEGVRRFTAKRGAPVNLALPPLNYGGHPYHHLGMPGTVIVREHVVREMMIDVMLGLWNDGFRKQLIVNNHGQLWMLESAVQEFQNATSCPAFSA